MRAPLYHRLSARLRQLREAAGLSRQQVGDRAGHSPALVSTAENGAALPSHKALRALAGALGADLAELEQLAEEDAAAAVKVGDRVYARRRTAGRLPPPGPAAPVPVEELAVREASAAAVLDLCRLDPGFRALEEALQAGGGQLRRGRAGRPQGGGEGD